MIKIPGEGVATDLFSAKMINKVKSFHQSIPIYQPTPLRSLTSLAQKLGVGGIYVKDESYRFGLNAFKALGASYAMAKYLAGRLNKDIDELPFEVLVSSRIREQLGEITFATTTDGNHGRGVAWTARQLKQKSVVYMPRGTSQIRLENIRAEGAQANIVEMNYDDAVRLTAANAKKYGWTVVQDTAWEGYEEFPCWIMQGYITMSDEACEQLKDLGVNKPTHVFVQAGVGSMAAAIQGYFASMFGENRPKTLIVEADEADCFYQSALAGDGNPRNVNGDMPTIMAGLACGEPNIVAWRLLRDYSEMFVSCPDWVAARRMRLLGNPYKDDPKVVSGESGAVTAGLLYSLLQEKDLHTAREALGLNKDSHVLLFSTEGDTDPDNYRRIVWDGACQSC
jgi:diaminopropionate ammonia-lyase